MVTNFLKNIMHNMTAVCVFVVWFYLEPACENNNMFTYYNINLGKP